MLASKLKNYHHVAKISIQIAIKGCYTFLTALGFKRDDIL